MTRAIIVQEYMTLGTAQYYQVIVLVLEQHQLPASRLRIMTLLCMDVLCQLL
jgi:hypothetical protein